MHRKKRFMDPMLTPCSNILTVPGKRVVGSPAKCGRLYTKRLRFPPRFRLNPPNVPPVGTALRHDI